MNMLLTLAVAAMSRGAEPDEAVKIARALLPADDNLTDDEVTALLWQVALQAGALHSVEAH